MLNINQIEELKKDNEMKAVFFSDEVELSWLDYYNLTSNHIKKLLEEDIVNEKTRRIIVISENNWRTFILYSVISSLGIPFSGIDYTQTDEIKLASIVNSESNLVFYSETQKISPPLEARIENLGISSLCIDKIIELNTDSPINKVSSKIFNFKNGRQGDIASFSFTSGTSGVPKVIYREKGFDNIRIPILTKLYNFNSQDIFLASLPFYHVSVTGWMRLALLNKGAIVIANIENEKDLFNKLKLYNVTTTLFTPPTLKKIIEIINENHKQSLGLRFVMVGGKNFPVTLKEEAISTLGSIIHEYYGSSETGINTLISSDEYNENLLSSGKVMEGSKIAILGENNEALDEGQIGKVAIHSFQNASGYIGNELSRVTFREESYIITSDFGKLINGYLYITQRSILDFANKNVNVFEIENHLRLFQHVEDIAILTENMNVYTFLTFSDSISLLKKNLLKVEFHKYLMEHLGMGYNIQIQDVDVLKYSLSGKVKYFQLENGEN
ncbi:AMP-binding protein [Lactococcus garvieae]|uniref:AMP-binding protein n=1 Tax=Lactococcus garvieae TaxID=1363 RepID=UPI0032504AB8